MKFMKDLAFMFNLLFFLSGISMVCVGAVLIYPIEKYLSFSEEKFMPVAIVLMVVGVSSILVAYLSCIGIIREDGRMLKALATLLGVVFLMETIFGAMAIAYRQRIQNMTIEEIEKSFEQYESDPKFKKFFDGVQKRYHCCGLEGPKSFETFKSVIPPSCCDQVDESFDISTNRTRSLCTKSFAHVIGCSEKLKRGIEKGMLVSGAVVITFSFLQLSGITFAMYMLKKISGIGYLQKRKHHKYPLLHIHANSTTHAL